MRPVIPALIFFAVIYAAALGVYDAALGGAPAGAGLTWHLWRFAGAGCLAASVVELVMLGLWAWQRFMGKSTAGGVPLRLTEEDRRLLAESPPRLAMLMPAHNEASTAEDRDALIDRLYEILLKTPAYSIFFLLADSPPSQRENELHVIREVKKRLSATGYAAFENRLVLEEYRDKPPPWRHKCGSLLRWLERYSNQYDFMFILDADSSLADEDPRRPETCDVVERMAVAMQRDSNLALVQASIEVRDCQTWWGWIQSINARVGASYYFPIFAYLYGRTSPCYGHNCLLRVSDFVEHLQNTLLYTSHDHVDAADLAAAGRGCVLSTAVTTLEQTEESLPMWIKRECRWSRGNGQWIVYLIKKPWLPLGVIVYLTLGVLQYLWALLASILLICAVVLIHQGHSLVTNADALAVRLIIGLVVVTLFLPKLAATRRLTDFVTSLAVSTLLGPTLMMFQGIAFLLGAFGSKWIPRGARSSTFDAAEMMRITGTFIPSTILGLLLWELIRSYVHFHAGDLLICLTVFAMIVSPITGLLLSWPWRQKLVH
jgi:hypothetical protein